jgi:hypothetical protein
MRPEKRHHRENEDSQRSAVQTSSTVDVYHLTETIRTFIAQPFTSQSRSRQLIAILALVCSKK